MTCKHCKITPCKAGDRYCGLCGEPLFERRRVLISGDGAARGKITLHNPLQVVSRFNLKAPPWVSLAMPPGAAGGLELQPNGRYDVGFDILRDKMGGVRLKTDFVEVFQDGRFVREVRVEVYPAPKAVKASDLTLYTTDKQSILKLKSPAPFTIAELTFKAEPPIVDLSLGVPTFDVDMGGKNEVPLAVSVSETGQATVHYRITTPPDDGSFVLEGSFPVLVKHPPTIRVVNATLASSGRQTVGHDVKPDERGDVVLEIWNVGDDDLIIERAAVIPQTEEVAWLGEVSPMKIEPGKTDKAKLRFRVRPTAADKYNAVSVVDFRSNDPTDPKVDIVLRVKEPLYPNYIAIDYGTSTSTAAYCDDTAKLLALEETDTKVASDVFFVGRREGEDPPYDYCIGRETEGLGVESYRRRATAAKVRVTETEPYEVEFDQRGFPVMPAEVARMGVLELVRFARSALGRRPSGIMFTVPTRFTLRQREALERVFRRVTSEKGLADTDVRFVDEAFAAGFYYLSEGIQADKDLCCCPIYTLMVIDVGGGTTDVTLFRVEQDPGSETTPPNIKKLEVLGAWGDQHLGGHALTMKVAEHLARQAGVAGDARPFEQTAERLKLAVSEYAKTLDDTRDGLVPADGGMLGKALLSLANRSVESLRKTPEPKRDWLDKQLKDMKNSRKVTVSLPSELGGSDLRAGIGETRELLVGGFDIFSAEVREILARCGIQRADKLLLCGQSSLLPDLPRSFKGLAAKFDYVRDPRSPNKKALLLKECVALGAALYANFRFRMTFEGRDKFWRILGTRDQGRFNALVPWGTTYPFETTCEFDRRFDVRQPGGAEQILQFNLWENLTLLPGRMQTDVYETFEIGIDGSKEDMFEGKVSLTREGQVEVYCRLGGAWQKMKPVGGQ